MEDATRINGLEMQRDGARDGWAAPAASSGQPSSACQRQQSTTPAAPPQKNKHAGSRPHTADNHNYYSTLTHHGQGVHQRTSQSSRDPLPSSFSPSVIVCAAPTKHSILPFQPEKPARSKEGEVESPLLTTLGRGPGSPHSSRTPLRPPHPRE